MAGSGAGGSAAAMPVAGPLAAHFEKRPCAGVSDRSGQRASFGEHIAQALRGRPEHPRTVGGGLRSRGPRERGIRADLSMPWLGHAQQATACPDASSRLPSLRLGSAELMEKRVAAGVPALCLLQRRQLLRLAEQAAGAALLGAPSLVVGHHLKLSVDVAPQDGRGWFE